MEDHGGQISGLASKREWTIMDRCITTNQTSCSMMKSRPRLPTICRKVKWGLYLIFKRGLSSRIEKPNWRDNTDKARAIRKMIRRCTNYPPQKLIIYHRIKMGQRGATQCSRQEKKLSRINLLRPGSRHRLNSRWSIRQPPNKRKSRMKTFSTLYKRKNNRSRK